MCLVNDTGMTCSEVTAGMTSETSVSATRRARCIASSILFHDQGICRGRQGVADFSEQPTWFKRFDNKADGPQLEATFAFCWFFIARQNDDRDVSEQPAFTEVFK